MKKISILGSTGSIGTQALDVIAHNQDKFKVTALSCAKSLPLLCRQIEEFSPEAVAVKDETDAKELADKYKDLEVFWGAEGLKTIASMESCDMVLNSLMGMKGLEPTMAAIESGKDIAFANKETLVAGGQLVMDAVKKHGVAMLPVDSEHSAIFQSLQGNQDNEIRRILLTASGGPFRGYSLEQLEQVSLEQALNQPNWSMGSKITIDSATLMNKGLELIEAVWLFGLPAEQVQVVVQRQSIIHSMVQFSDNSILAQLGVPDMRIPIQYALTWPERVPGPAPELDFTKLHELTFDTADEATFRCLAACKKAIGKGGLAPCAANGANEEAVRLFLEGRIPFLKIGELVEGVVDSEAFGGPYTLDDVYACDAAARAYVLAHVS